MNSNLHRALCEGGLGAVHEFFAHSVHWERGSCAWILHRTGRCTKDKSPDHSVPKDIWDLSMISTLQEALYKGGLGAVHEYNAHRNLEDLSPFCSKQNAHPTPRGGVSTCFQQVPDLQISRAPPKGELNHRGSSELLCSDHALWHGNANFLSRLFFVDDP